MKYVVFIISLGLLIFGVDSFMIASRTREKFDEQVKARPLDIKVDLSKPGEYSGKFHQTWNACHGQSLSLHLPANVFEKLPSSKLPDALDFKWRITDSDDKVVIDEESCSRLISGAPLSAQNIQIAYFHPIELGDYRFKCTVVTAIPELAGIEQRIVSKYQPCGLELVKVSLFRFLGIVAFVIAGILMLGYLLISRRKKIDTEETVKE